MMNRIRQLLATGLSAVVMVSSPMPGLAPTGAGTYFLEDGFYFGVKDGEAYIHGYEGDSWDVVINEKFLNTYDVTSVEQHAFFENNTMEALSFFETDKLRSLGDYSFARCTKLKEVLIPPVIQEMGTSAFSECTALKSARFYKGAVAGIPAQTFSGCTALENVRLENEPASIGAFAFSDCTSLTRMDIPDSVTEIADTAFYHCDNVVIYCSKASYAHAFAAEHAIAYVLTDASIRGDADGDGDVSILDATRIQRKLAGFSMDFFDEKAACITSDKISILDATAIQRYLVRFDDLYHIGEYICE